MKCPACFAMAVIALFSLPLPAQALEEMCTEQSRLLSLPEGLPGEQAGASDTRMAPGPAASMSGPRTLVARDSAPLREETQTLWCAGPDDPRCAPREGAPRGPDVPARSAGVCLEAAEPLPALATQHERPPALHAQDGPRDGFARSLERPPQPRRRVLA